MAGGVRRALRGSGVHRGWCCHCATMVLLLRDRLDRYGHCCPKHSTQDYLGKHQPAVIPPRYGGINCRSHLTLENPHLLSSGLEVVCSPRPDVPVAVGNLRSARLNNVVAESIEAGLDFLGVIWPISLLLRISGAASAS